MSKDQSKEVEFMVRAEAADRWEHLIGKEVRMSEASKRTACAVLLVLAISFLAVLYWLSP